MISRQQIFVDRLKELHAEKLVNVYRGCLDVFYHCGGQSTLNDLLLIEAEILRRLEGTP